MQGDRIIFSVRGSLEANLAFSQEGFVSRLYIGTQENLVMQEYEPFPFRRLNQIGRPKLIWGGAPKLEFDLARFDSICEVRRPRLIRTLRWYLRSFCLPYANIYQLRERLRTAYAKNPARMKPLPAWWKNM